MTVAKYYPYNGERGRLRLGLCEIELYEWLQYEEDFADRIHEKKDLIKCVYRASDKGFNQKGPRMYFWHKFRDFDLCNLELLWKYPHFPYVQ